ncbi:MAG TPA: hypothetical protein VFV01_16990 [Spirillospora sp.]|nr:hypothetical protein [Spirillospora sp.]
MCDFYLPPEQWAAVVSAVLLAVSAAAFWVLRKIDQAVTLP